MNFIVCVKKKNDSQQETKLECIFLLLKANQQAKDDSQFGTKSVDKDLHFPSFILVSIRRWLDNSSIEYTLCVEFSSEPSLSSCTKHLYKVQRYTSLANSFLIN